MCIAAHRAELGIEAALIELDKLSPEDLQHRAALRDEAEVSLEALEAEWQRTAAWIDGSRKQLAHVNIRAAELTRLPSLHVGATGQGAYATLVVERFPIVASLTGRASAYARAPFSPAVCAW
jgi:hypothetical protein